MITLEAFTALAHRTASRYSHRSEPDKAAYTFLPHTLADFHRLVCEASSADKAPAPPLPITGHQLREAIDFLAPDGTHEQLEESVEIQHGPSRVNDAGTPDESIDPEGLYCWLSDYPEEGSIALTGDDARIMHATAPQPAAQAEPTDSMGLPLSCGKPLCSPGAHHPLCALAGHPEQDSGAVAYIRRDQLQKAAREGYLCEVSPNPRQDRIPIYTAQPERVPLTDEKILAIYQKWGTSRIGGFTAAVREVEWTHNITKE